MLSGQSPQHFVFHAMSYFQVEQAFVLDKFRQMSAENDRLKDDLDNFKKRLGNATEDYVGLRFNAIHAFHSIHSFNSMQSIWAAWPPLARGDRGLRGSHGAQLAWAACVCCSSSVRTMAAPGC